MVSLDQTDEQVGAKAAGDEPLPGYRLIEPLGRGGFGEVWKCEAPGGLFKAIKFVAENYDTGSNVSLRQEFKAFQRIKAILRRAAQSRSGRSTGCTAVTDGSSRRRAQRAFARRSSPSIRIRVPCSGPRSSS